MLRTARMTEGQPGNTYSIFAIVELFVPCDRRYGWGMHMLRTLLASLAAAALCACASASAPSANSDTLHVERVVMLMRHGIRPPTRPEVTPAGVAAEAWPSWEVPLGHLTQHGYDAILRLGAYERAHYGEALFAGEACPRADEVLFHADTDQRTIRTAEGLAASMFPGCTLNVEHLPLGELDVLYSPTDQPGMDIAAAHAAILAEIGSLDRVRDAHGSEFDLLQRVLGCCGDQPDLRARSSRFTSTAADGRPKTDGPMNFAPTAVMTLVMEYTDGRPMSEVGWGRVTRDEITTLTNLYVMKVETIQRPYYVGARGASPLMRRMLEALNDADGAKFAVFLGHDTNISDLSGLLDVTFHLDSYAANFPPPGGAFGFELLRDDQGRRFVRTFVRAQTLDQMRELTALSEATPPSRDVITIPGCAELCPLEDFTRLVEARLL